MSKNAWSSPSDWFENSATCLGAIAILLILFAIGPLLVMWLWNWIAVDLFSAPVIGFWQAFGLQWLCRLLFGHTTVNSKG